MEIKNNFSTFAFLVGISLISLDVRAENAVMNTAQMQALDKITGQMKVIDVPVDGEVSFGSFSIVARSCQANPPEDIPENYAFIDIADTNRDGKTFNIFKGWMVSSSPSLNSVEHPIYDVWLLKCYNTPDAAKKRLSQQQLDERDKLEKMQDDNLSKEAKIAKELQEEQAKREAQEKAHQQEMQRIKEENKERQEALDKEIQAQQNETSRQDISIVEDNDGEGPVSLLNIGQHHAEERISETVSQADDPGLTDESSALQPQPTDVIIESNQEAPEEIVINTDNDSFIVIEDTHHETIDYNWELPDDINEVLPQTNPL